MGKYPQVHVASKYQEFLKKLAGVGKPEMVDQAYVKKLGFKSSYDANFLAAIKFIGLVEEKRNGAPTELWSRLRIDFGGALAEGLRSGYSDVFSFYPDAHLRDEEALTNYFRGNSDEDAEAVSRMVNAFTAVRDIAKFNDSEEKTVDDVKPKDQGKLPERPNPPVPNVSHAGSQVNLNIQLQLPADATGEIYDKFFEAMKKHGLI